MSTKQCKLGRFGIWAVILIMALPGAAYAGSVCVAANLSAVVNTSCSIGGMTFNFGALISQNSNGSPWTAANFNFVPLSNGFALAFLGGPQSLTAPSGMQVTDFAELSFSMTDSAGITQAYVSPTGSNFLSQFSVSGTTGTSLAFNWLSVDQTSPHDFTLWQNSLTDINGALLYLTNSQAATPSFMNGDVGIAYPFVLQAQNGNSATWSGGTAYFTFNSPFSIPEPSSLLLFGAGLVGLLGTAGFRARYDF